ncbi:MAG: methyltransferase domain-containing protein [Gammaproteobacteria bacterium]|nr:MAG: methyltransferase domain-containing protein [Gammaproteobacteria bacterium]
MQTDADLKPHLACPRCDLTPLDRSASGWHCGSCRVDFPVLDGMACLYSAPSAALGEWRGRLHAELRRLQQDAKLLDAALAQGALAPLTKRRLELRRDAARVHHDELRDLLAPLLAGHPAAGAETYLALRTRPPTDQGLTTYYSNVHRDWCWGDEENRRSVELISEAFAARERPQHMLVLGCGAGRLARDLHEHFGCRSTVAMDFNPLLMLIAARMFRGETLRLHEFPIAPKRMADQAVARTLEASPAAPGLTPLLGDALRPPFAPGSFDTVVTPWVLDILPDAPAHIAARINRLLQPDGRWISFGSLSFSHADPALCLSLEETLAMVEAAGFAAPDVVEAEIPYMCSPASRHGRREQLVTFCADRIKEIPQPERHTALPDWIVTGRQPVPVLPHFQMQMLTSRVHLFIMSLIDGKRTLEDMAQLMEAQQLMSRAEAEPAIRTFLERLYEDSQREKRF